MPSVSAARGSPSVAASGTAPAEDGAPKKKPSVTDRVAGRVHHVFDVFVGAKNYVQSAHLPPYTHLSNDELAAARSRGQGKRAQLQALMDARGSLHEPVSLHFNNSAEQVTAALERAGWEVAQPMSRGNDARSTVAIALSLVHLGKLIPKSFRPMPMTTMYCDGEPQTVGLEKNNVFFGRDHLRVYQRPDGTCDVAASRDVAAEFNLRKYTHNHRTDGNTDLDRDLVMADLLKAGQVQTWRAVQGVASPEVEHALQSRQTDRQVYDVTLKGLPKGLPPGA